jgi:hypothetical protein
MDTLEQFLSRADEVAAARGWARTTLSKRLFGSGSRLDQLHTGADLATKRFRRAISDLEEIATEVAGRPTQTPAA